MNKPMLDQVLGELASRKGSWRDISKAMDPVAHDSYYSWLTKLAQGTIKDPSVNKIQRLFDYFHERSSVAVDAEKTAKTETQKAAA